MTSSLDHEIRQLLAKIPDRVDIDRLLASGTAPSRPLPPDPCEVALRAVDDAFAAAGLDD